MRRKSIEQPLAVWTAAGLEAEFAAMTGPLADTLAAQETPASAVRLRRVLELRAPGTETALEVEFGALPSIIRAFREQFERRFGFAPASGDPVVATLQAEAIVAGDRSGAADAMIRRNTPPRTARAWFDGWRQVPLHDRASLTPGETVAGPALIVEPNSTTVVEPGWAAESLDDGSLRLARRDRVNVAAADPEHADPARLELFNHRFMQVAEQMGAVLQATASLRQHPRAAGFFLRAVRRRGRADRQCAAHAGASRLDGRQRARGHRRQRRRAPAWPRLDAQCALRRRHAPARHHGRHSRIHCGGLRRPPSSSPRARTMPTSAASRPGRCRRPAGRSTMKACCSTISC